MRARSTITRHDESGPSKGTLLTLLWAFCTTLWTIFTPPHFTFAARIVIFQPAWLIRTVFQDSNVVEDLGLFLVVHGIYGYHAGLWRPPIRDDFSWVDFHDEAFLIYFGIFGLLAACGVLAGGIVHRGTQLSPSDRNAHLFDTRIDEQLLPPLLILSRTSHSRMFPQKHSFVYSYLLVGVPVGASGKVNSILSVDGETRSWFHVNSDDYLARGSNRLGLGGKLKQYLHTQGVTDREYAFAYLVTAPRFLGYSFNPASFWYIYDSETVLQYIIVEVNNTFGERRVYFVKADDSAQKSDKLESKTRPKEARNTQMFTNTWQKDFHVSPFNSTKGSYSLKAVDPLAAYQHTGEVAIDNTIVLRSSKDSAKIVARVWSDGAPRDATTITLLQRARFIAAWWWVGFVTFPRILVEASKLFFRKRLNVWYRPEVVETSLGRSSTEDEIQLEAFFRAFLQDIVEHAEKPLCLTYQPADSDEEEVTMYSPGFTYEEVHEKTITIKVLSPAFYSRLVHYAHIKEAFDRECLATEEKNRTVAVKSPHLLPLLLEAVSRSRTRWSDSGRSLRQRARWYLVRRLRCPAPAQSYVGSRSESPDYSISDIRTFREAELDRFITHQAYDVGAYQRIALKLFVAERFAFGIPAVVSLFDWIFRALLLFGAMYYSQYCPSLDVLRSPTLGGEYLMSSAALLLLANAIHARSFITH